MRGGRQSVIRYKPLATQCMEMSNGVSLETYLESPNQRMEDRKKSYISQLEGSLEKISEEKGRCQKSVTSIEEKISHLQTTLEKERQWKETADELHQSILRENSQLLFRYLDLELELNENKLSIKMRDLNIKELKKDSTLLEIKCETSTLRN